MPHTFGNGFGRLKSPAGKGIVRQRCVSRKQPAAGSFPTSSKTVSAFSLTVSGIRPTPEPCRRHGGNRSAFRLDRRPTAETRPFHRPFRPGGQNRGSGRTKTESVLPMCALAKREADVLAHLKNRLPEVSQHPGFRRSRSLRAPVRKGTRSIIATTLKAKPAGGVTARPVQTHRVTGRPFARSSVLSHLPYSTARPVENQIGLTETVFVDADTL